MKKASLALIKYYPIIMNLYILIYGSLVYFFNINDVSIFIYTYIGQSFMANVLFLLLSKQLLFCFWHRLLIYNMSFVLFLETISNFGIKIKNDILIDVLITAFALLISAYLYNKHGCSKKKDTCSNFKKVSK